MTIQSFYRICSLTLIWSSHIWPYLISRHQIYLHQSLSLETLPHDEPEKQKQIVLSHPSLPWILTFMHFVIIVAGSPPISFHPHNSCPVSFGHAISAELAKITLTAKANAILYIQRSKSPALLKEVSSQSSIDSSTLFHSQLFPILNPSTP